MVSWKNESLELPKDKLMVAPKSKRNSDVEEQDTGVTFYHAWCKRCGICVAFCPTKALELDEWDYPHLANPEKCTMCHLCEKLCPDFAIGVGETVAKGMQAEKDSRRQQERPPVHHHTHSPERVVQPPSEEEEDHAEE